MAFTRLRHKRSPISAQAQTQLELAMPGSAPLGISPSPCSGFRLRDLPFAWLRVTLARRLNLLKKLPASTLAIFRLMTCWHRGQL
jgi:hypothetical protein